MDLVRVGERIRREREHVGYTQRQLADLANLSQPTLDRTEKGSRPTVALAELDRIATALAIPLKHLISGNPVRERTQIAARINTISEKEQETALRQALAILELDARLDDLGEGAADRNRQIRRHVDVTLSSEHDTPEEQGRQLAVALRAHENLGTAQIADIDDLIEQLTGVDTAVVSLPANVDGLTLSDPERDTTLIVVRCCTVPERQRFTFAHELAHLLYCDGRAEHQINGERTPFEERSDAFARHLLAPVDGIRAWLEAQPERLANPDRSTTERQVALLARHFRVSFMVALIQLERMGEITAAEKWKLKGPDGSELAQKYGWGPTYEQEQDAANTIRPPRRILERATLAYRGGHIGIRALAGLEGRSAQEAQIAMEHAGLAPTPLAAQRVDLKELISRRRRQPQGTRQD